MKEGKEIEKNSDIQIRDFKTNCSIFNQTTNQTSEIQSQHTGDSATTYLKKHKCFTNIMYFQRKFFVDFIYFKPFI